MKKLPTVSFIITGISAGAFAGENALAPGLAATFRDDVRSVTEIVALPEIGLAAEEAPHPAIKPAFSARFEGFLAIARAGTYEFETKGTLMLNGEVISTPKKLQTGKHPITLTYQREPAPVRFGVSWQSEHFVREPLPPSLLFHEPIPPQPENADGTHPAPSHRIRTTLAAMPPCRWPPPSPRLRKTASPSTPPATAKRISPTTTPSSAAPSPPEARRRPL